MVSMEFFLKNVGIQSRNNFISFAFSFMGETWIFRVSTQHISPSYPNWPIQRLSMIIGPYPWWVSLKIIAKLLANRMQQVVIPSIHKNQYGFIKSRTIHDCLAWAFEYIHMCHKSKKEVIILKLDFEKAFHKVEYMAILQMLQHMWFLSKWLG